MPYDLTDLRSYIEGCHMMRNGTLERLTDADLQFSPGGDNFTLGELFKQLGEYQHSYIQSLISLKQDWSYRNEEAGLATGLAQLKRWFKQLDQQMQDGLNQLNESDLQKQVERSNGFFRPISTQLDIYIQMMIFLGKVVIYFRAMQKPLPPSIVEYVG